MKIIRSKSGFWFHGNCCSDVCKTLPQYSSPPLVVNEQPPNNEQSLLSPESREEGEYREVILCAEESIEVTWCQNKPDADVWDAISPKNVQDL